jgi:hypothetical protein
LKPCCASSAARPTAASSCDLPRNQRCLRDAEEHTGAEHAALTGEHDAELALSTAVITKLALGISKIRPDERAQRLADGLEAGHSRFAGRIFAFTEEAALS